MNLRQRRRQLEDQGCRVIRPLLVLRLCREAQKDLDVGGFFIPKVGAPCLPAITALLWCEASC
jgi:hypothetical protein